MVHSTDSRHEWYNSYQLGESVLGHPKDILGLIIPQQCCQDTMKVAIVCVRLVLG